MGYEIDYYNIKIDFEKNEFLVLDQKLLPFEERYIKLETVQDVYDVIKNMNVRGAPLIGIVALIGLYLGSYTDMEFLKKARPTAINIFNYFNELKVYLEKRADHHKDYKELVRSFIIDILKSEYTKNLKISQNGFEILKKIVNKERINFLTHCNTGSLATIGLGTALGIIKYTSSEVLRSGGKVFVWVDETRPYLQGSRLTAWELHKEGIEFKIITDNSAAYVMSKGLVDVVCVGADRIAKNGDTANKIGTLNLAILCKYYGIPFIVAAPNSSIDTNLSDLRDFEVEERQKDEVIKIGDIPITRQDYEVFNPSFDITPCELIDYIVLDSGVYSKPYNF
ncbi:MAG: S-methyl-5-thioribose-1-phosphate isomerase [Candidatus Calescibacterium sp.]|nr:S-methyl-5-thioribose-1-phosphate isomerase [Candidatus Calescibacterium sp.]MCX7971817.1 S-methyl-5-thioribose-1-phosphate isomerase [bacterium]MDW8194931.1 S-methyl-5-thioribose-1-phosphate isomerase [Candidatus Calescibacterium sp.]